MFTLHQVVTKAIITFLMVMMLYTANSGLLVLGLFVCCLFGSSTAVWRPSLDLFLFLGTAMMSKHIESLPEPHEYMFDAHILGLAGLYLFFGDKFRVSLLAVWLPYYYINSDRGKCGAYISLAAVMPMLPYLRLACQVVWPSVSAMLRDHTKKAISRLRMYAVKVLASVVPYPFSSCRPEPTPPTFSFSPAITTAIVEPLEPLEEPKQALMVDGSTQTEPFDKTECSTQVCEDDLAAKPVYLPKKTTRYIVTGNGIVSAPPNYEQSTIKRGEPSRIRKQRLRELADRGSASDALALLPALPIKPVKSVRFAPISSPGPYLSLFKPLSPNPPVVDDPIPLSSSLASNSQSTLASTHTSSDVADVPLIPAAVPDVVLTEPLSEPEPTSPPAVVSVHTSDPESSPSVVESDPVSTLPSHNAESPTSSIVKPATYISVLPTSPLPYLFSEGPIPAHRSSVPKEPSSPISDAVTLQGSPTPEVLSISSSILAPATLFPSSSNSFISSTVACIPASPLKKEPEANAEAKLLFVPPALPADNINGFNRYPEASGDHVPVAERATSLPISLSSPEFDPSMTGLSNALIIAPGFHTETDSGSVNDTSGELSVEGLGDPQVQAVWDEVQVSFDGIPSLDEIATGLSDDPSHEFRLTQEDVAALNDIMFGSGNKLAAPLTADELEEKLVEEFIGIQDHPTIEDYPTVPDFFAPELGEQMEGITAENPCTVDHVSDEMVIDGTCALVTESPDIVMSGEESKDESMDVDHQMDDIDPMDEREDTGNIFGLRPSTDVALTTAASKLADIDSHMDEDSTTFDMSELLSSLSSTPEALAAQTSSVEPLTLGPTAEQQIGGNNGSTQPLSEPPPDTPSTTFSDVFDLADLEAQLASDIASLVPDADALSTPAPATASTAAPPVSFTAPSTLISTVPAPENAVSTSPTASSAPSDARATLAPASIRNKMPPRPRAAIPPIPFIRAPSPTAPKFDSRFLVSSTPREPECKILALDPGHRPTSKQRTTCRTQEVYVEDYMENEGFRQKALWQARGCPSMDEEELVQLVQRMEASAEEAKKDWPSRRAGIEEQTKLDLAAKKARDKKIMGEKHAAARAAAMERIKKRRQAKPQEVSIFMTPKRRGRV